MIINRKSVDTRSLTASRRRRGATAPVADIQSGSALGLWQKAVKIRLEWLDDGLSTQPASHRTQPDQDLRRHFPPPAAFEWVSSPRAALPLLVGLPALAQLYALINDPRPHGKPPLASDLAMSQSWLRGALSAGLAHCDPELVPARKGKHKSRGPSCHRARRSGPASRSASCFIRASASPPTTACLRAGTGSRRRPPQETADPIMLR